MRTISDPERRTLKAATDGAYVLSGGISRILDFTRVSTSQLSKYASFGEDNTDSFAPIDVAVEIDRADKSPTITKEMAALLGFELVPVGIRSDIAASPAPITEKDAMRILKEGMDVSQAIVDALTDNRIDAAERKNIGKEARELIRVMEDLVRRLEAGT
ncbi:phage regulatory CII family protein [Brucella tritici]|uniref:phage regulatory CII family protein n=1 Tax=Brucella tritici TaxID=94626 RepID=UPI003D6D1092